MPFLRYYIFMSLLCKYTIQRRRKMEVIFENLLNFHWQQLVMWTIGGVLIYLAIKKDMEPTLLLPLGFGTILVNLPLSGAVTQLIDGVKEIGIIDVLFNAGISNELFPLLLFIGIGAMIDFTPLLTNPKMLFFEQLHQKITSLD